MIKMQSPIPNRKGVYEVHDVVTRKIDSYRAAGWLKLGEKVKPSQGEIEPAKPAESKQFDLSGSWFTNRAKVKKELGLEKAPASKLEAGELLRAAGYEVTGD